MMKMSSKWPKVQKPKLPPPDIPLELEQQPPPPDIPHDQQRPTNAISTATTTQQ
jgi:hypothetical protein